MNISNNNGLWIDNNSGACVGYMMNFKGHGIYSPDGKVEVTPEQAEIHNKLLSEGEILGLDNNCQVGQCGTFYFSGIREGVKTFTGTVVAPWLDCKLSGKSLTFQRKGKTFRGRLEKDSDCFNFKRIS